MHLVTTKESIATEKTNFNFVYSSEEDTWHQWQQIYMLIPYLVFYALDICEVLMALMAKEVSSDIHEVSFHRSIGFMLWAYDSRRFSEGFDGSPTGLELIELSCPKCKGSITPNEARIRHLFEKRRIKCPKCRRTIKLPELANHA